MRRFFIRNEADSPWEESYDVDGKKAWQKFIEKGGAGTPEIYLIKLDPGIPLPAHKHAQDEIEYILEGEIWVGDRVARAGSAIFVRRGAMYGPLKAGPHGVKYLNIQPRKEGRAQ